MVNYFMKISQIKDQLAAIGDLVEDIELLTCFSKEFLQEGDCPSLTSYGQIALKRNTG
jgi:hypothetical protein